MAKSKVTMAHVFKTIIWPRKNTLFIGLFLIVVSRLSSLVLPWASQSLMDDVIVNKNIELLKQLLIWITAAITIQATTSFLLTKY